jgi:hypothetical protein
MKKRNLKNLQLQKKSISKLDNLTIKGQGGTNDSDFICRLTRGVCLTEDELVCLSAIYSACNN